MTTIAPYLRAAAERLSRGWGIAYTASGRWAVTRNATTILCDNRAQALEIYKMQTGLLRIERDAPRIEPPERAALPMLRVAYDADHAWHQGRVL